MAQPLMFKTAYSIDECRHQLQNALSTRINSQLRGFTVSDHRYLYGEITGAKFTFHFPSRSPVYLNGTLASTSQGTLIQIRVRRPLIVWGGAFLFGVGGCLVPVGLLGSKSILVISLFFLGMGVAWLTYGLYAYDLYKFRLIQQLKETLRATPQ